MIGTAAHDAGIIETDEVHRPRDVVDVEQQRGIGTHHDHVAVALQAEQERRFRERRRQVALADAVATSVFAHINFRAAPVGGVVPAVVIEEGIRSAVLVVVHDLDACVFEPLVADDRKRWILGANRLDEL